MTKKLYMLLITLFFLSILSKPIVAEVPILNSKVISSMEEIKNSNALLNNKIKMLHDDIKILRIIPLISLFGIIITVIWGVKQYKLGYYTRDWSGLIEFLSENPKFMNPDNTKNYKVAFKGDELTKYEMIARRCLGYLDDMYFMNSKKNFDRWFKGSISLLAGRHKEWLADNKESYDKDFYDFIMSTIGSDNSTIISGSRK